MRVRACNMRQVALTGSCDGFQVDQGAAGELSGWRGQKCSGEDVRRKTRRRIMDRLISKRLRDSLFSNCVNCWVSSGAPEQLPVKLRLVEITGRTSIEQFSLISAFILATGTRLYNSSSDALISTFSHPKPNSFILCFNKCWLLKMGMKVPSAKTVSFATHTCLVGCTGRTEVHALTMTWFLKRDQPDSQTLQQFIGFYLFLVHVTTVTHQVLFYSMVMKKWTQRSNKKASWHKFTPLAILNLKKEIFSGSGSSGTWSLQ